MIHLSAFETNDMEGVDKVYVEDARSYNEIDFWCWHWNWNWKWNALEISEETFHEGLLVYQFESDSRS